MPARESLSSIGSLIPQSILVHVQTDIVIDQPLEMVSDYAANPDNAPHWYVNIQSAKWKTPKPLQKGSQVMFTAKFMGKELQYTYEIVQYIPREKLVMRTAEAPFPMETSYTWEAISDRQTQMILSNTGEPSGFSRLMQPFIASMMKRANKKDLQKLKEILERST